MDTAIPTRERRLAIPFGDRTIDLAALWARYGELAFVLALTGFSGYIRFWHLTTVPYGFHNDEGNVALDAKRILEQGWIGPWSLLATGYPIAVNYYIAPFIKVFGFGILGVRLPMALLGTLTIPLAYYTFREAAGWRVAVCGSIMLSVLSIHLHLSRIGFPVLAWPALELVAVLCLLLGMRTRAWPFYVVAGLAVGVGVWAYNSVFLFAMAVAIYLAGWMLVRIVRRRDWETAQHFVLLAILGASALFAAWPIYEYQQDDPGYRNGFKARYIFNRPEYDYADTFSERATLVKDKAHDLYRYFTTEPHPDGADGLGVKPPYGKVLIYLAFVGAAAGLWRLGNPMMGIGLLAVPLVAMGSVVTVDGQFRRSFGIAPFVVFFAALTLGMAWEWADRQMMLVRAAVLALVIGTIGTFGYQNLKFYFDELPESGSTRFVFFPEMRQGSEFVGSRGHPYMFMYSERATMGHESRRVLADNIAGGEDRGSEWTHADPLYTLAPQAAPAFPARVAPDGAVWVFFGRYAQLPDDLLRVIDRYPGGEVSEVYDRQYRQGYTVQAGDTAASIASRLGFPPEYLTEINLPAIELGIVDPAFETPGQSIAVPVWNYRAYYLPGDLLESYSRQESVTYPVVPKPQ